MRLLAKWDIERDSGTRSIELLQGDLALLPAEQAVDVLVVSAFREDYAPTTGSLIGALARSGVSVAQLAREKYLDQRHELSCWLSRPVLNAPFKRILCLESGWRGDPPEITDDLFRALAACACSEFPKGTVAMPIIGSGDQQWDTERMLKLVLETAESWMNRGLSVQVLKIVVYSPHEVAACTAVFEAVRSARHPKGPDWGSQTRQVGKTYAIHTTEALLGLDIFLSYSHEDTECAHRIYEHLRNGFPKLRIFFDRTSLKPGASWLMDIAESLDSARRIVAIYTPHYWASRYCKDEFTAALTRQIDTGEKLLCPLFFKSAQVPYLFRTVQYFDCREGDSSKIPEACKTLCDGLVSG